MLKKVKLIFAVMLMACLFLPLSTCTQQPHPKDLVQEDVVFERYAIMTDSTTENISVFQRYGVAVVFVLPLIFSLAALFRSAGSIFYALVDLCAAMAIIFVMAIHALTGQLVIGGYLAMFAGSAYLLFAMFYLYLCIRDKLRQKEAVFKAKS